LGLEGDDALGMADQVQGEKGENDASVAGTESKTKGENNSSSLPRPSPREEARTTRYPDQVGGARRYLKESGVCRGRLMDNGGLWRFNICSLQSLVGMPSLTVPTRMLLLKICILPANDKGSERRKERERDHIEARAAHKIRVPGPSRMGRGRRRLVGSRARPAWTGGEDGCMRDGTFAVQEGRRRHWTRATHGRHCQQQEETNLAGCLVELHWKL